MTSPENPGVRSAAELAGVEAGAKQTYEQVGQARAERMAAAVKEKTSWLKNIFSRAFHTVLAAPEIATDAAQVAGEKIEQAGEKAHEMAYAAADAVITAKENAQQWVETKVDDVIEFGKVRATEAAKLAGNVALIGVGAAMIGGEMIAEKAAEVRKSVADGYKATVEYGKKAIGWMERSKQGCIDRARTAINKLKLEAAKKAAAMLDTEEKMALLESLSVSTNA